MEMLPPGAEMIASVAKIRPLKRVEYERLAAEGFFDDERIELLFGMVVVMPPIDAEHNESVDVTRKLLEAQLADRARVRIQSSFVASDDSEPQPDVFVIPNGSYWKHNPDRSFLIAEISRSSIKRDRAKQFIYANGTVDEYWIVNHDEQCVEVFRDAHEGTWRNQRRYQRGESLSLLSFPDVTIAVDAILPPSE